MHVLGYLRLAFQDRDNVIFSPKTQGKSIPPPCFTLTRLDLYKLGSPGPALVDKDPTQPVAAVSNRQVSAALMFSGPPSLLFELNSHTSPGDRASYPLSTSIRPCPVWHPINASSKAPLKTIQPMGTQLPTLFLEVLESGGGGKAR